MVTISRVLTLAEHFLDGSDTDLSWLGKKDGASLIAKELFENATDINFFVGKAINPAHQNPDLPITFGIKIQLIENLCEMPGTDGQAHQGILFLTYHMGGLRGRLYLSCLETKLPITNICVASGIYLQIITEADLCVFLTPMSSSLNMRYCAK